MWVYCVTSVSGIFPGGIVWVGVGDNAVFNCLTGSPTVLNISWLLNGTAFNHSLPGVTQNLGTLVFSDIPAEYNNTNIFCIEDGMRIPGEATLVLQGTTIACLVPGLRPFLLLTLSLPPFV